MSEAADRIAARTGISVGEVVTLVRASITGRSGVEKILPPTDISVRGRKLNFYYVKNFGVNRYIGASVKRLYVSDERAETSPGFPR